MKREPRIAMAKEVLTIGMKKVKVDYEFRNESDDDITTLVAFPVPAYALEAEERSPREQGFDDFRLTVEDQPARFQTESRAKLKGRDVTSALKAYGIDIPTFGHYSDDRHQAPDIRRLSKVQRLALVKVGLLESDQDADFATWTVEKKYYWTQTFPAHATIHIRHEYSPVIGYGMVPSETFAALAAHPDAIKKNPDYDPSSIEEVRSVCPDETTRRNLEQASNKHEGFGNLSYVDFILTTANTWKQPIEDFTLFVERPEDKVFLYVVSFCWNGPVEKIKADRFKATATNLIPQHELRIGFFGLTR